MGERYEIHSLELNCLGEIGWHCCAPRAEPIPAANWREMRYAYNHLACGERGAWMAAGSYSVRGSDQRALGEWSPETRAG